MNIIGLRRKFLVTFAINTIVFISANASGYDINVYTDFLQNGLKVYYIIDNSTPVVTTLMYYKTGSFAETADKNGLAHIMEHMMFGETDSIPPGKITGFIEDAGGSYGAYTSYEETIFYTKLPSNHLRLALWIESQRIGSLRITERELEKQKRIIIEELKARDLNQPYSEYYTLIPKIIYDAWPIIGNQDHIRSTTVKEIEKFYKSNYRIDNAALVILGDFGLAEGRSLAREYFGGLKNGIAPEKRTFTLPNITENYKRIIQDPKAADPAVFINFRGPGIKDSNYYFMNLLAVILANGTNSRLYRRLESADILNAEVTMSMEYLENMGLITIKAILPKGTDLKKVEEIINSEINFIAEKGVTADELENAVNYLESKLLFEKLDKIKLSEKIARYAMLFDNHELINSEFEKYKSVALQQITSAVRQFLTTGRRAVLLFED